MLWKSYIVEYVRKTLPTKRALVLLRSQLVDTVVYALNSSPLTTVLNHRDSQLYVIPVSDNLYCKVTAAKAATLAPDKHTHRWWWRAVDCV